MNLVVIGAGQSGRGFIPQYLVEDTRLTFVDVDFHLIQELNETGTYTISYYGTNRSIDISDYQAYPWDSCPAAVFQDADYIAVSVGEQNFEAVVLALKRVSFETPPVFITFENGIAPADHFEALLKAAEIPYQAVTQCAIFTTTNKHGIDILSEDAVYLPYDCDRYTGVLPFNHIEAVHRFDQLLQRKIFTYNCLSAVICYPGYYYGFEFLHEAAADPVIKQLIHDALDVLNPSLASYFGISETEQVTFSRRALDKFESPYIVDSNVKNGRDIERKLGLNERLFGPIGIIESTGRDVSVLFQIVGYALYMNKILNQIEPVDTLLQATGLDLSHPWICKALECFDAIMGYKGFNV